MFFVPYAPPTDHRPQTPLQRKRASRFALVLFTLTALVALLLKYLVW